MRNLTAIFIASWFSLFSSDYSRYFQEPYHREGDYIAVFELPLLQCSVANFYELQLIKKEPKASLFKLNSFLFKPNHSYLLVLNRNWENVQMRSFRIDQKGKFLDWDGNENEVVVPLDQVGEGEMITLDLYDIEEKTYFESSLTIFPKEHFLGQGKVRFSYKQPLPFIEVEFSGMEPKEEVAVVPEYEWEQQKFTMDETGYCKNDIYLDRITKFDPKAIRVICASGEFECPLPASASDWNSPYKQDAILILTNFLLEN